MQLQFHYIKGSGYRETACHGALGGVTPQRKIWMALYAERPPIPRTVEFEIDVPESRQTVEFNEAGTTPTSVETRKGVVRHIEILTYMDLNVAEQLRDWLSRHIDALKSNNPAPTGDVE